MTAGSLIGSSWHLLEMFDASYGTDLFWLYEEDAHVDFYDLIKDKETAIKKILRTKPIKRQK